MRHMQLNNKGKLRFVLLALVVVSFASCLKDTGPVQDYSKSPAIVGFQYKGVNAVPMTASILKQEGDTFGIEVTLSVATLTLKKDVSVTIAADPASLDAYNAANGTTYKMIDASTYTVPAGGTLVIPAGQQIVPFNVIIDGSKVDFDSDPGLAFRITAASGATIASNLDTIIVPIKLKNPYEASYTTTGYFVHPSAPRALNATKTLSTVSVIRSEGQVGDLGGNTFQFDVDTLTNKLVNIEATGATSTSLGFINNADNASGNSTYPGPPYVHTTYNNTYDPATQTFWMHYGYSGSAPAFSREIYEKWVRQ